MKKCEFDPVKREVSRFVDRIEQRARKQDGQDELFAIVEATLRRRRGRHIENIGIVAIGAAVAGVLVFAAFSI